MKIYVDADGSPVVKETIKVAKEYELEVIVVKNFAHELYDDYATIISVDVGFDSADYYIANRALANDIVITQDYGLAALCLAKNCIVLNQNGFVFTELNINTMLDRRYTHAKMRAAGQRHTNPKKRKAEADVRFENSLRSLIQKQA